MISGLGALADLATHSSGYGNRNRRPGYQPPASIGPCRSNCA
jgi:hypothetical protein